MPSSYTGPDFVGQSTVSGLGAGGTLGATIGSAYPGAGTAIGGGIGAAAGAGIGALVGYAKQQHYKKELKRIQGLTNAERDQAQQRALQNAGQQAGQAQAQIARDTLSDKGSRNAGMYSQAQAAVAKQAAEAGAGVAPQIDALSQQLAESRRQELLQQMNNNYNASSETGKALNATANTIGTSFVKNISNSTNKKHAKAGGPPAAGEVAATLNKGKSQAPGAGATTLTNELRARLLAQQALDGQVPGLQPLGNSQVRY